MIVPTLCVGMPRVPLRVTLRDAEHPGLCSHAERGNNPPDSVLVVGIGTLKLAH